MPLNVSLQVCDEATIARTRPIAFCSVSATTGPTSRSASRRTTQVSPLRISIASAVEKDNSRSILALFSESAESPFVAKSNGHFSVPDNRRAYAAATTRIAAALPRRVPSCAVTPPRFFGFGLHFAAPCAKPTAPTHLSEARQHKMEMYKKMMTTVHKHSDATSRSAAGLYRELSLCILPSLPRPPAGGPGSPELALADLEARSMLPGAACSM